MSKCNGKARLDREIDSMTEMDIKKLGIEAENRNGLELFQLEIETGIK